MDINKLRKDMVAKGATEEELKELKRCQTELATLKKKYQGGSVAEIAEDCGARRVNPYNRDFLVTYYRVDTGMAESSTFHTLKELSDWFNKIDEPVYIMLIDEVPGRAVLDKYYKNHPKVCVS